MAGSDSAPQKETDLMCSCLSGEGRALSPVSGVSSWTVHIKAQTFLLGTSINLFVLVATSGSHV